MRCPRFFRDILWSSSGLSHLPGLGRPLRPPLALADRCLEADYRVHRRVYLPLILYSLTHDLAKGMRS